MCFVVAHSAVPGSQAKIGPVDSVLGRSGKRYQGLVTQPADHHICDSCGWPGPMYMQFGIASA